MNWYCCSGKIYSEEETRDEQALKEGHLQESNRRGKAEL
jgi:hypothetical protein